MRLTVIALLACVLCACTPMKWVKPDATPEQLSQDAQQCRQDAWREARARSWYYQPMSPIVTRDAAGRAIVVTPSSPFSDPMLDPALEEGRLAQACMQSKGYQLVPREPTK